MADLFCKSTPHVITSTEKLTTLIAPDSLTFLNSMDPTLSSFFSENDDGKDSWFRNTYFNASLSDGNDDYLVSPQDIILDNTSVAPNMLSTWGVEDMAISGDSSTILDHSRTPSLCEEANHLGFSADSQLPTPAPSPELEAPPKCKRGRPRLNRTDSDSSDSNSRGYHKMQISNRQPHSKVERKYREGLNAGLERLRIAVPTLPRCDSQIGLPKPSKATVLAAAIDYIHKIEMERDRLQLENKMLKTREWVVAAGY